MKKIISLFLAITIISVANVSAQMPTLEVRGTTNEEKVYLKELDIKVDVVGNISTTTMTMVFQNKTDQILEGTLTFPLPDGVTVSGYALDINGKMREAVPVDKSKGTQVFEEIERRRVDPGLLERVEGNNFRTRIYPIPSKGSRTVSISYEETLLIANSRYTYRLPMDFKHRIPKFGLTLNVWQDSKPILEAGDNEIRFDKHGTAYVSKFSRTNYTPAKLLAFSVPTQSTPDVIMQSASGSYYFTANYFIKNKQKRKKQWANTIGLIWDASLSTQSQDISKEVRLLDAIISNKQNLTIKLGLINNTFTCGGNFVIKDGEWSHLRKALLNVVYDGGTNYKAIDLDKISSNEYILFSDGISTLSEANIKNKNSSPIHCIVSSTTADYSALKSIALNSNAKFINLNTMDCEAAKNEILHESYRFLGIQGNSTVYEPYKFSDRQGDGAVSQVYPSIPTDVNEHFSIAGITNAASSTITLQFGYGNTVSELATITLDASKFQNKEINVHKIWAQKKIAELDMNYDKNKNEIIELAQQFGIVTRNTSLIVLELISDYVQYGITPPQELMAEYNQHLEQQNVLRNQQRQKVIDQRTDLLKKAENHMLELKTWWNIDFKNWVISVRPLVDKDVDNDGFVVSDLVVDEVNDMSMEDASIDYDKKQILGSVTKIEAEKIETYTPQQAKLTMIDIKNDAEYMKRLTGNTTKDYRVYIEERKSYGGTPSFYFNMAGWFMKHNDREKAIRILTSIAEIGLENISAYKMLAFRLKEYNESEMLLFVTKKLIDWRPFEQQSYRDYALALKEAGKYQLALDSLYSSMLIPVNNTEINANMGMNIVILTEINNLISLHKHKLNTTAIDANLVYSMPVDVRVVINWNTSQTHIDAHITDPRGEVVKYSNNRSQIGGRMDAHEIMDFGPEQFLLKRGTKGKYKIEVDYWGDSKVSQTNEPATIMTEIYIGYSSGREVRKIVCFNLSNANIDKAQKKITIAEFEI